MHWSSEELDGIRVPNSTLQLRIWLLGIKYTNNISRSSPKIQTENSILENTLEHVWAVLRVSQRHMPRNNIWAPSVSCSILRRHAFVCLCEKPVIYLLLKSVLKGVFRSGEIHFFFNSSMNSSNNANLNTSQTVYCLTNQIEFSLKNTFL